MTKIRTVDRGRITAITCGNPSGVVKNAHGYYGKKVLDDIPVACTSFILYQKIIKPPDKEVKLSYLLQLFYPEFYRNRGRVLHRQTPKVYLAQYGKSYGFLHKMAHLNRPDAN